jgi:hypothetical protein
MGPQPAERRLALLSALSYPEDVVDDARARRLALNETTFRSLNEKIAGTTGGVSQTRIYEFVCECSTPDCFEHIALTGAEYEEVRKEATRFLVLPGHDNAAIEHVVARNERYLVVQKDGAAGRIAGDENPRHEIG